MNISRYCALNTLRSIILPRIPNLTSNVPLQLRMYARKPIIDPDDEPIKFSTSGAVHGIADIRRITMDNRPWYQGPIAVLSVSIFLIYFCILREESDLDLELDRSLYDRYDGLEVANLQIARRYYIQMGNSIEVSKIDARLKELGASAS